MGFLFQAESCDSLQTFVMMHSIGGGTGSGVGSYILELLHVSTPGAVQSQKLLTTEPLGGMQL